MSPDTLDVLWDFALQAETAAQRRWRKHAAKAEVASEDILTAGRMQADIVRWAVSLGWTEQQIRAKLGDLAIETARMEGIEL